MQKFLDGLLSVVQTVNSYLSDYILIILLVGVGVFYTVKTRCVQVRCFKQGMKQVFGNVKLNGGKQKKGMSSFQAFTTAVAAQVGTGNIIGASGAILAGGPGAIFWMCRKLSQPTNKVLAIFVRTYNQQSYTECTYLSKGQEIDKLPISEEIKALIQVEK